MNSSYLVLPSNRKFGFFFSFIFAIVGAYLFRLGYERIAYVGIVFALLFSLVALVYADALLPLNKLWMRFGLLLGSIVSPFVLGLIFFLVFTPVSLAMKMFCRDELRLKLIGRRSHWKKRNTEVSPESSFKNQF